VESVFKRVRDVEEFVTAPILRLTSAIVRRERNWLHFLSLTLGFTLR
jgi:hypothetical protein